MTVKDNKLYGLVGDVLFKYFGLDKEKYVKAKVT